MKLGILVSTDRYVDHVLGLAKAALSRGHEVIVFVMDEGTRLLGDADLTELCMMSGVTMSFCQHSASNLGVTPGALPGKFEAGSQYLNAAMVHNADRVIVL